MLLVQAYLEALRQHNQVAVDAMLQNQRAFLGLFGSQMDFWLELMRHQAHVLDRVSSWHTAGWPQPETPSLPGPQSTVISLITEKSRARR